MNRPKARTDGFLVVRDRDGRPKVSPNQLRRVWPHLSDQDREYLRARYPNHRMFQEE